MELFSPNSQKTKKFTLGKWNFLALILRNISYFHTQKNFSYILGNGKAEPNIYISGNGIFLYFRKRKTKKLLIFQERELFELKK